MPSFKPLGTSTQEPFEIRYIYIGIGGRPNFKKSFTTQRNALQYLGGIATAPLRWYFYTKIMAKDACLILEWRCGRKNDKNNVPTEPRVGIHHLFANEGIQSPRIFYLPICVYSTSYFSTNDIAILWSSHFMLLDTSLISQHGACLQTCT